MNDDELTPESWVEQKKIEKIVTVRGAQLFTITFVENAKRSLKKIATLDNNEKGLQLLEVRSFLSAVSRYTLSERV